MQNSTFTRWFVGCLLVSVVLSCAFIGSGRAGSTGGATNASASAPALDVVSALRATGPHRSLGDQTKLVGGFVGTWDVEYTDFKKDGTVVQRSGEYIVGWVLDGRALQDVWIVYPSAARKEREVYTTLHYLDPKSGAWRATFVDPEAASVLRFTGRALAQDRFALESQDIDGKQTRWSYNDVRHDSFVWRDEESSDGGQTWRLRSEYHMKRRGAVAAAL
jgi:hypothetical protein